MDSKIIAAMIGVGGVSLGAFLGGVGYYLKSRNERQQTKKMVLYHLLELRHLIKSSYLNPSGITEEYINYCNAFFRKKGISDEGELPETLRALLVQHIGNAMEAVKPKIDDTFIQSYEDALRDLCKSDPILAFKLRGRERVADILHVQNIYIENFMNNILAESSKEASQFLETQLDDAGSKVLLELIADLNKEILLVSWRCSVLTWFASLRITRKNIKPNLDFEKAGIDKLLEKMLNDMQLHESHAKNIS